MNEKTKNVIEELKALTLDMYRSAGKLDEMIQTIETEAMEDDEMFVQLVIKNSVSYRNDFKTVVFGDLDAKENRLLKKLVKAIETES